MPIFKRDAVDEDLLARRPFPASQLSDAGSDAIRVSDALTWFDELRPRRAPHFVAWRERARDPQGPLRYHFLLRAESAADALWLLPLPRRTTPLDVLGEAGKGTEPPIMAQWRKWSEGTGDDLPSDAVRHSLRAAVTEAHLGPPLPPPTNLLAVAANYPSHLESDLAVRRARQRRDALEACRVRVFRKHPPTPRPDARTGGPPPWGYIGPFDPLTCPARVRLPRGPDGSGGRLVPAAFDYEVELGLVVGRPLDAETVASMDDAALREAIVGRVLVSDAKVRNPQAFLNILSRTGGSPGGADAYRSGDRVLDAALGDWGRETCAWWSHAASCGSFSAVGPVFVAEPAPDPDEAVGLLSARSYGTPEQRDAPRPPGVAASTLYLRQCAPCTESARHPDRLIWSLPRVLRSLFLEASVLDEEGGALVLEPGDILLSGTPGGVVVTAIDARLANLARRVLFWRDADAWHDHFFGRTRGQYLHRGDRVLFWGQGLGHQLHEVDLVE